MKLRRVSLFVATTLLLSCTRQPPSTPTSSTSPTGVPPDAAPLPATSRIPATTDTTTSAADKTSAAHSEPKPAAQTPTATASAAVKSPAKTQLDLTLSADDNAPLFDRNFDATQQNPYRKLFDLTPRPRERNFSVSGDLFWDEEKLKQPEVNYLDALKGGEISIEVKTR